MEYTVTGQVTISVITVVEADTKEEALKIAASREELEWSDINTPKDRVTEVWLAEDLDGSPEKIKIEE